MYSYITSAARAPATKHVARVAPRTSTDVIRPLEGSTQCGGGPPDATERKTSIPGEMIPATRASAMTRPSSSIFGYWNLRNISFCISPPASLPINQACFSSSTSNGSCGEPVGPSSRLFGDDCKCFKDSVYERGKTKPLEKGSTVKSIQDM